MKSAVFLTVLALCAVARADKTFKCPGKGQYASAPCSSAFYNCGDTEMLTATNGECPADLFFNEKMAQCDYASAIPACPTDASKCPDAGNFPTGNCEASFYSCSHKGATPLEMNCTADTYFSPIADACEWRDEVLGCTCTTVLAAAKATPQLSTLVAALEATGLDAALDNAYLNVTVFAPTNDAFAALLAFLNTTATDLLKNTTLVKTVLGVHVAEGSYLAKDLTLGLKLPSLVKGQDITVTQATPTIMVAAPGGQAGKVIKADLAACWATVHIIDRVLLPRLS